MMCDYRVQEGPERGANGSWSNLPKCQCLEDSSYSLGFGLASGYWERSKVSTLLMTQSPCCGRKRERISSSHVQHVFFCYRQVLPPLLCTHVKRFASLKEAASSRSLSINTDKEDFKRLCSSRMPATRVTSSSEEEFEFMKISRDGAEAATNCRSEFDFPTVPRFLSILIMEETLHSLLHRSCTTHHHRSVRVSGKWWGQRYVCGRSNSAVKQFIISCVVRFQGLTR